MLLCTSYGQCDPAFDYSVVCHGMSLSCQALTMLLRWPPCLVLGGHGNMPAGFARCNALSFIGVPAAGLALFSESFDCGYGIVHVIHVGRTHELEACVFPCRRRCMFGGVSASYVACHTQIRPTSRNTLRLRRWIDGGIAPFLASAASSHLRTTPLHPNLPWSTLLVPV